jgi:hypothetical protein
MADYRTVAFVLAALVCPGSVTAAEKGDREPARQVPGLDFKYKFELLRDRVELRWDRVERQNVLPGLPSSILELPVPPAATAVSPPLTRSTVFTAEPASPGPSEGATAAQKMVLYEEDSAKPYGKQFVGSAVWRIDRVSADRLGQKPEVKVRADIEIPEWNIAIRWTLRRNENRQLPASHTVEIMFTLPPDFPHGGIANVPGLLVSQGQTSRGGTSLNGVAEKVMPNLFLIGLSPIDADVERNIHLLKERSYIDIPVLYSNGKRAIIAIEKGAAGERAFTAAFDAWQVLSANSRTALPAEVSNDRLTPEGGEPLANMPNEVPEVRRHVVTTVRPESNRAVAIAPPPSPPPVARA